MNSKIPLLVDGDHEIAQSSVILRLLGERYGLGGHNEREKLDIAVAEAAIKDVRTSLVQLSLDPDFVSLASDKLHRFLE